MELVGITLAELNKVFRDDFLVPVPKSLADAITGITVTRVDLNLDEGLSSGGTQEIPAVKAPVLKSTTEAPRIAFKLGKPSDLLEED